jgi:hypothetical protein
LLARIGKNSLPYTVTSNQHHLLGVYYVESTENYGMGQVQSDMEWIFPFTDEKIVLIKKLNFPHSSLNQSQHGTLGIELQYTCYVSMLYGGNWWILRDTVD